ncbi:MAG: DUF1320 domain-containing protein [Acidobacteria bacterium]|nr:DUF1320 domain-containing protein [Acidobacteriota bacterium]
MALYATVEDFEQRLPVVQIVGLCDGAAQGSAAYTELVTRALTAASAEVDSYAGARYALPLQSSERLEQLTLDVAVYWLQKRRNMASEAVRTQYEDAVRFLRDLAAGKAVLDQPSGADAQTVAGGGAIGSREDAEYVFSSEALKGY